MAGKKNSVVEIIDRRLKLQDIIADYEIHGKHYTQANLLTKLHKAGYDIDLRTLQRDLDAINAGNDFVTRLATVNYSSFVDNCFKKLDDAESKAIGVYNKKWTQSKHIKKEVPVRSEDGHEIVEVTESVITTELAGPKLQALRIYSDIQKIKLEMVSGNLLDDSVAAMTKKFQDMQQKVATLEEENASLKEQQKPQQGGPIVVYENKTNPS
jgi:vacuolar-type H+-ATPase subunit I/STV1